MHHMNWLNKARFIVSQNELQLNEINMNIQLKRSLCEKLEAQLELFKKVVEEVVTSETGTVSSLQVLNFEFGDAGNVNCRFSVFTVDSRSNGFKGPTIFICFRRILVIANVEN